MVSPLPPQLEQATLGFSWPTIIVGYFVSANFHMIDCRVFRGNFRSFKFACACVLPRLPAPARSECYALWSNFLFFSSAALVKNTAKIIRKHLVSFRFHVVYWCSNIDVAKISKVQIFVFCFVFVCGGKYTLHNFPLYSICKLVLL